MEKHVKQIAWYSLLTLIMVVVIGVGVYTKSDVIQQNLGSESGVSAFDLIGTKTGTSTVGVGFRITTTGGQSATTTYPYMIGNEIDQVTFTAQVKAASSTANMHVAFLGSNDIECDTASTTSSMNAITTGEINWFDISGHLLNLSTTATFFNSTSTLIWDTSGLDARVGKEMTLTDLNYNCVALQVSGSSTVIWAQLETKKFR